jgi:hypothetical protein
MSKTDQEVITEKDMEIMINDANATSDSPMAEKDAEELRKFAREGLTPDEAVERILSFQVI